MLLLFGATLLRVLREPELDHVPGLLSKRTSNPVPGVESNNDTP
jgi:hypothetical protein